MIKFPSIEQFRNVVHHVKAHANYIGKNENGEAVFDHSRALPTLKFQGTVKLHGTNAAVVYDISSGELSYQSRERVLSLEYDNAGFMAAQVQNEAAWLEFFEPMSYSRGIDKVAVYGEWCGQGIQRGVAISELPKMFVIFAVKFVYIDGTSLWSAPLEPGETEFVQIAGVRDIEEFSTWELDIDFNHPELAQNRMIEITEAVEAECPVGKHFGVSGVGEGVVWTCVTPGWEGVRFKVKGEKHSASKVKTLAPVDVEAVATLKAFVEATVTEARLEQGLDNLVREQLKPLAMTSMGDFIRWVYNDVVKEEADTLAASGIDPKKIGSAVANVARPWFVRKINS